MTQQITDDNNPTGCKHCVYFIRYGGPWGGECRRHAPVVWGDSPGTPRAVWPHVTEHQMCGDFVEAECPHAVPNRYACRYCAELEHPLASPREPKS